MQADNHDIMAKCMITRDEVNAVHDIYAKAILSAGNGMNIYRGCTHGCIYCDARSTCYQVNVGRRFEDIGVKVNAAELLEQSLKRKRKKCMIGTGGMSDPYMHCEKTLKHTRQCLELIDKYGFGLAIQTKSDLILRDLDLLRSINKKAKCVVQMTLTTADESLCKVVEPHVCTTKRRAQVLNIMRDEGIPTVCWMTPILPFINDTTENVQAILDYCKQSKTVGILAFGIGMTLRNGDREYYYRKLDQHFPGLKQRYIDTYGDAYEIPTPNSRELMQLVEGECEANHMMYQTNEIFSYLSRFECKATSEQMNLFGDLF